MSYGNMNTFIKIVQTVQDEDAAGFAVSSDIIVAEIRAYREDRHGTKAWANRAAFSTAAALFRFRVIPGVKVTDKMEILCGSERFRILSVEDVKNRGMYLEVLAETVRPTKQGGVKIGKT